MFDKVCIEVNIIFNYSIKENLVHFRTVAHIYCIYTYT